MNESGKTYVAGDSQLPGPGANILTTSDMSAWGGLGLNVANSQRTCRVSVPVFTVSGKSRRDAFIIKFIYLQDNISNSVGMARELKRPRSILGFVRKMSLLASLW